MSKKSTVPAAKGRGGLERRLTAGLDAVGIANCQRILRGGMAKSLGFTLTGLKPDRVTAQMKLMPRHLNFNGRVNGGAIMAFADLLGAIGAGLNRPAGYRGGTLESKTNFFSSGHGPYITGLSIPLHIGRTTSVWQTTVHNSDGRTIAIVTQTQMALPMRSEPD
ncbi:MAG: PaaI family thioesterase [Burkholderiales bacterium]|nr:PaaI family thioesterase [Burkholderiales bacterium]